MSFAPNPTVDPRGNLPHRDPVINLPFTRTEEEKAMERLEQKRQWEQQIKDRLGNILGSGKSRMAGEAIGVDAAAAAEGNKVGEAIGATVGGLAGGAALAVLDGPAPVLDVVGSTIGTQIGGAIGAHIPQLPFANARQDAILTDQHQQLISARDPRSQGQIPVVY
tara:strand:+ start:466 stop:960 length:495 start_codon:yes stop_codon:yes gene_type:complete